MRILWLTPSMRLHLASTAAADVDRTARRPPGPARVKSPANFGQVATSDSDSHYTPESGAHCYRSSSPSNAMLDPPPPRRGRSGSTTVIALTCNTSTRSQARARATLHPPTAAGDGSGLYINGAAVAPTG